MEIEEAFFASVLDNFPLTPIAYPGEPFDPKTDAPDGEWLQVLIFRNEPANQPLGNTRGVEQGIMQITACRRPNMKGSQIALTNKARLIQSIYPKGYTFASYHRIVNNPYMLSLIVEPDKIMLPVSMSYSA